MSVAVLVLRLGLAIVFAVAAAAKLGPRAKTEATLEAFGAPPAFRPFLARTLPAAESAIAIALLPAASAAFAGIAATALLLAFSVAIARVLRSGEEVDCNCFGRLAQARITRLTLGRNLALMVPAAIVAASGLAGSELSAVAWIGDLDAPTATVGIAGTAVALAALAFVFSWQLLRQNGRLLARLDALEAGSRRDRGILARPGEPMPAFELPDLAGRAVGLGDLLAADRGLLLVFTDPGCHACNPLLPLIGSLQRDGEAGPEVVVVSRGDPAANAAKASEHGLGPVLLQEGFELPRSVGVEGLPGAIALDREGRIDGMPALGAEQVAALLTAVADGDSTDRAAALDLIHVGADR